ncbi:hypothetical protein BH11PSE11_BH11PSE11_24130 [soil metagenome]
MMPLMHRLRWILAALVFTALPSLAAPQNKPRLPPELDQTVKSLIVLMSDNHVSAYDVRLLRSASAESDPEEFTLVSFTLESFGGGNEYSQYVAAFERIEPEKAPARRLRYRLVAVTQVGAKAWRAVDFDRVTYADGRIVFNIREYRANEAFCCPSKPGKATYLVDRFSLKEVVAH